MPFTIYAEIKGDLILDVYQHHREAYMEYHRLAAKLTKAAIKRWKANPDLIPQINETSPDGFDKAFECSCGYVYVEKIPEELEINQYI
jgi:hypothetical protein